MSLDVGTLAGYLDLDTSPFDRKLADTDKKSKDAGGKGGKSFGDRYAEETDKSLSDRMSGVAGKVMRAFGKELGVTAKPTAMTVATAFSGQLIASVAAGLASGATKVAHGFAAGLALLPAVAASAMLAVGTVKLAFAGMGDALKAGMSGDVDKFNESLKGLAPSAQSVLREVVGLKGGFDALKATVQERFFENLVGQAKPLADLYLPKIEAVTGGIATAFGATARQTAEFFKLPPVASAIGVALNSAGFAAQNVVLGLGNLVQAFVPLITVGASFLPGLSEGFGGLTNRFAEFMAEAERSGRLRDFIQGGIDSVKELVETGRQVGRIIGNIGSIFSGVFDGLGGKTGGLLDSLERLSGRAAAFFKTAEGGSVMAQVFDTVGAILNTMLGTLQRVGGMLADVFGPILPDILDFVEALADLKSAVLDTALDALEPILAGLGDVLGGVVLPVLTDLANWLSDNQPVLEAIGIAIMTLLIPAFAGWAISAGTAAAATILAMAPIVLLGAAIAGLAYLVITHFDTIKRWISNVWQWVSDHWPLLLGILTFPIAAAVGLIVTHWDTIWNAGKAVFDWIGNNWQLLFAILTGPIGLAVGWIVGSWDSVVGFVAGLPSRIGAAASGMWDGIKDAFKAVVNTIIGWWNGISFTLPTIHIPGFDPPGPGPSFGGMDIGGQTFSTPNIGYLHTGGLYKGSGDMLAIVQGGEEVLSRSNPRNIANIDRRVGNITGAGAPTHMLVTFDGSGVFEGFRETVRVDFGGDVQVALGQG